MKRIFTLLALVALTRVLTAQPVLPLTVEPAEGAVIQAAGWYPPAFFDPGPAGENQSWDFSNLTSFDVAVTRAYIPAAGTPFAANFPAATRCMRTDATGAAPSFTYYSVTDSSVSTLGLGILGGNIIVNTIPWERKYPLHFGETETDTIAGTNNLSSGAVFFQMVYTRTYDGYGGLILTPGDTYQNAIRIKTTAQRRDSVPRTEGTHVIRLGSQEYYSWFVPNVPGNLFWTSKYNEVQITRDANGDTTKIANVPPQFLVEYQTSLPVPVVEPHPHAGLEILGNPARDWLTLRLTAHAAGPVDIRIADLGGSVQYSSKIAFSGEDIRIPVGQLPAGMYVVQINTANGPLTKIWEKI